MSNAAINISIKGPDSENSYRRAQWFADGERGGMINLMIHRTGHGKCLLTWNGHNGRGWLKGWRKAGITEAEALAFAETKWPQMIEGLDKLEPKTSGGAAAVFSAQVATMQN